MNELAVSIGVILFPGLIASVICDKTAAHHARWDAFKYSIYSFIFGVACYAMIQVTFAGYVLISNVLAGFEEKSIRVLDVWWFATRRAAKPDLVEVFVATLLAPVVACAATFINNRKLVNRFFRLLRVSYKYGDENLFSHYLGKDEIQWVYVRDPAINQSYRGFVLSYSETDHIQEIVLSDVTVYNYETAEQIYTLPSIYLAKTAGAFVIEAACGQPTETCDDDKATAYRRDGSGDGKGSEGRTGQASAHQASGTTSAA